MATYCSNETNERVFDKGGKITSYSRHSRSQVYTDVTKLKVRPDNGLFSNDLGHNKFFFLFLPYFSFYIKVYRAYSRFLLTGYLR
jgi:hypothetical protein